MKLTNVKNNQFFDLNFLQEVCKQLNLITEVIDFYPQKITSTKFGLRQAKFKRLSCYWRG